MGISGFTETGFCSWTNTAYTCAIIPRNIPWIFNVQRQFTSSDYLIQKETINMLLKLVLSIPGCLISRKIGCMGDFNHCHLGNALKTVKHRHLKTVVSENTIKATLTCMAVFWWHPTPCSFLYTLHTGQSQTRFPGNNTQTCGKSPLICRIKGIWHIIGQHKTWQPLVE